MPEPRIACSFLIFASKLLESRHKLLVPSVARDVPASRGNAHASALRCPFRLQRFRWLRKMVPQLQMPSRQRHQPQRPGHRVPQVLLRMHQRREVLLRMHHMPFRHQMQPQHNDSIAQNHGVSRRMPRSYQTLRQFRRIRALPRMPQKRAPLQQSQHQAQPQKRWRACQSRVLRLGGNALVQVDDPCCDTHDSALPCSEAPHKKAKDRGVRRRLFQGFTSATQTPTRTS